MSFLRLQKLIKSIISFRSEASVLILFILQRSKSSRHAVFMVLLGKRKGKLDLGYF